MFIANSRRKKSSHFQFKRGSWRFCQKNVQNVLWFSSGQTASVHTLHMPCDIVRVQGATQCSASVHILPVLSWDSKLEMFCGYEGLGK